jgi:creatinine amidohydrolase/Fe(II)-dependent formamide hydrolase-like protein
MPSSRSFLLTDLSWHQVEAHLQRETRLIVPVGCCDQFGPHLPLGTATMIAEAFARRLSEDFGVLRAPAIQFGVNLPTEGVFAGASTLGEKTLHRTMNDLLAGWEDCGFTEFILLTAHRYDPHVEAIATVSATTQARVRVIELLALDLSSLVQGKPFPAHGGEVMTALMLHLRPDLVERNLIEDFYPYGTGRSAPHRLTRLPPESTGVLGFPTLATPDSGARIFNYVLDKIRARVFIAPEDTE